jgi:glycosyltransferase involved in cell wall biosynthesis
LWPYKRTDEAIEAFAQAASERPDATLDIAGPGETSERDRLVEFARRLGVASRVRFLGNVAPVHLARLYHEADVMLYLSEIESFGLPVLEAMAAGVPVIAKPVGGLPEVGGDVPAWVAPTASPAEVGDVLRRLLTDSAERARRGDAGRARAAAFTWSRAGELTAAALRRAVDRRSRPKV